MVRRIAPYAVYSNIFLVMLGLGVIAPNLTDIRREFGVSYGAISWGVSAFAFARLITNLPAGIAAGRYPRLPLLMAGTACVAVGSVAAALSTGLPEFLIARAISGVGSAISTTVGLTAILEDADPARRGRASGMFHSALGGGALFGPGFGAVMTLLGDWRWSLFGAGGAALLSFALLGLVLAMGGGRAPVRPAVARTAGPQPRLLGVLIGGASFAYIAAFAIFFVRGGVQQTVIPLLGRDAVGLSVGSLSILLMVSAAIGTVLGPAVGGLTDRLGRGRVLVPGLILLAIGTLVLASATSSPVFIAGVIATSLAGTAFSIPSSMIVDAVSPEQRAAAIGLYRVVGDAAFTGSPFVSGYVLDEFGFAAAGVVPAVIIVLALVAGLWSSRRFASREAQRPLPLRTDEAST
ncbi:MAG: MFS transporter [Dehalococcoidia bacterium]